ncbi:MAG: hypothetical protein WA824_06755 [Candidatus Sulfotelmatobacter sp.]
MAFKTLVTNPSSLAKEVERFLQSMKEWRGDFFLAMLAPSETSLPDKWNLVLSAWCIDNDGLTAAIPEITSVLLKYLSKANARKLERVSVLPTSDPLVQTMADLRIGLGEFYLVQYLPHANDAIVLLAGPAGVSSGLHAHAHTRA